MGHINDSDTPPIQHPGLSSIRFGHRNPLIQGWTLLETIVAISIFLLLSVLAVSIIGKAQARGDNLRCQSNLRDTGIATMSYIIDRNGTLLPSKHWYSRVSSQGGFREYLMDPVQAYSGQYHVDTILTCYAIKRLDPDKFPTYMNRGYSLNQFMLTKDPASKYDKDESSRPPLPGGAINMVNIPNPSSMWMFMDTGRSYATNLPMNYHPYQLFFPHDGKSNLVFADLHISNMTHAEVGNPASLREFWGNLEAPY